MGVRGKTSPGSVWLRAVDRRTALDRGLRGHRRHHSARRTRPTVAGHPRPKDLGVSVIFVHADVRLLLVERARAAGIDPAAEWSLRVGISGARR